MVKLEPRDKGLLLKSKNRKGKDKNIDIKILDSQGIEKTQEVVEPKESETEPAPTTLTQEYITNSVGALFDLTPSEISQFGDKIDTILQYAKSQVDEPSPENLKWAIRSLQGKVGTPPLGEKWINYLGKYCYLKLESMKLNKETEKYEHN